MALMQILEASFAQQLDPSAVMLRNFTEKMTEEKAEDVTDRQLKTIEKVSALMAKAEADGAPEEVKAAYAKILARYQ